MAFKIPTTEPTKHIAGDTATWKKSLADYPADEGWVLSYALVKTGTLIVFSSTADGKDHLISVPTATTGGWTAGNYSWQAKVNNGIQEFTVGSGQLEIMASFADAVGGLDARSHAVKTLKAIEDWIEGRKPGVAEYQVAGRTMKYIPVADLLVLRDKYRREVYSEKQADRVAAGLPRQNVIKVRF